MIAMMSVQRNKVHPHKFTLWVALASIIMMFAGLTSAYIVKRNQPGWESFDLPLVFSYSTFVILLSSLTIQWAVRSFKERAMGRYRTLLTVTAALGMLFVILQIIGFFAFHNSDMRMVGLGSKPSFSFILAIGALHAIHVIGGVVALLFVFFRAYSAKNRSYSNVPVEVVSTYWHFVDALWIYLFVFFTWLN